MKLLTTLFFLISINCYSQDLSNFLYEGDFNSTYFIYDVGIGDNSNPLTYTTYIPNTAAFLTMFARFGQQSANIFGRGVGGVFDITDFIRYMSGYSDTFENTYFDIESVNVVQVFSSGWILEAEGLPVLFLHATIQDELSTDYTTPLKSFYFQGVTPEGLMFRIYCHKY